MMKISVPFPYRNISWNKMSFFFPFHFLQQLFSVIEAHLHLNKDVRGQWSTVSTEWRAGCHSLTSLFPLGSGRPLLGDQLSHNFLQIPRVWGHWASHGLHQTIIPAFPLSSYQSWWWINRQDFFRRMSSGCIKSQDWASCSFLLQQKRQSLRVTVCRIISVFLASQLSFMLFYLQMGCNYICTGMRSLRSICKYPEVRNQESKKRTGSLN